MKGSGSGLIYCAVA